MRRFYFLLFSLALLPCLAQAQTTAITLQVTDSGSQQWLNGTWSATLVSPPGSNPFGPPFFQLGTATTVPNQSQSGTLSGTGSATMTLSQNAFISPSGSGWSFNVCSLTTAINRCFTQTVTITSVTTVTLTPPVLVVNPGPNAQAYADAEIQGAVVGSQYYNTSSNIQRVCNGPSPCTWAASGGAAVPNQNLVYLATNCSGQANCFTVHPNSPASGGSFDCGVSWTTGSHSITLSANALRTFQPADVGTIAWGAGIQCGALTTVIGAVAIQLAQTTISAVSGCTGNSCTTATFAGAGFTNNCTTGGSGNCVIVWGDTDETTVVNNWFAAVTTTGPDRCGTGVLPFGLIFVSAPIIHNGNCTASNYTQDVATNFAIIGQGGAYGANSVIVPVPTFNASTCPISSGCMFQNTGLAGNQGVHFRDFSINAFGGAPQSVPAGMQVLTAGAISYVNNVGIFNWGQATSVMIGINLSGINGTPAYANTVGVFNSGGLYSCQLNSWVTTDFLQCQGNGNGSCLNIAAADGGDVYTNHSAFGWCQGVGNVVFNGSSGIWHSNGDYCQTPRSTFGCVVLANSGTMIKASNDFFTSSNATSSKGLTIAAGATAHLSQTVLVGTGTTATGLTNAGTVFDECGNSITGTTAYSGAGNLFGSCSITGILQTAGNFSDGTGLGTSTFGTISGSSTHGQVTVTYAGALTTTPQFTMTFPVPFLVAPSCTLIDTGGTNAFPTSISNGAISTTSAVFNLTFAVAPTAGNTDIFVWECMN